MSANLEGRVSELEKSYVLLVQLLRRHSEKFDEVSVEQSNADVRIAALADAQIGTEDAIKQLVVALTQTGTQIAQLTARVDKLADTVERYIGGRDGNP